MATTRRQCVYAMSRRRRAVLIGLGIAAVLLLIWADHSAFTPGRSPRSGAGDGTGVRDRAHYHGKRFAVTQVVDGDTLELGVPDGERPATRVRLLGIDAPEAGSRTGPPMFYSRRAASRAAEMAMGIEVTVYLDLTGPSRGRYGRLLAYLEMPDGAFLNEVLIADGCAYADRRFQHSYYQKYKQLEAGARSGRRGLWQDVSREQLPAWLQRMESELLKP